MCIYYFIIHILNYNNNRIILFDCVNNNRKKIDSYYSDVKEKEVKYINDFF